MLHHNYFGIGNIKVNCSNMYNCLLLNIWRASDQIYYCSQFGWKLLEDHKSQLCLTSWHWFLKMDQMLVHGISKNVTPPYQVHVITFRNRSFEKIMFCQACVKNSVHREGYLPPDPEGVHPQADTPGQTPPSVRHPPSSRHWPWADTLQVDIPMGRHPPGQTSP